VPVWSGVAAWPSYQATSSGWGQRSVPLGERMPKCRCDLGPGGGVGDVDDDEPRRRGGCSRVGVGGGDGDDDPEPPPGRGRRDGVDGSERGRRGWGRRPGGGAGIGERSLVLGGRVGRDRADPAVGPVARLHGARGERERGGDVGCGALCVLEGRGRRLIGVDGIGSVGPLAAQCRRARRRRRTRDWGARGR